MKNGNETLSHILLTFPLRQYVIEKIKAPLQRAIEMAKSFEDVIQTLKESMSRCPEPTKENCHHPNTLVWMRILDKFLEMEADNSQRKTMFRAMSKLFLVEHEHDHSYYGVRIDVILEMWLDEVLKGNYKPRSRDYPNQCWKVDPNVRGPGFEFISQHYLRNI